MATENIVFITGGNTGIGYETVKALAASPISYTILMGSRSVDKAKSAMEKLNAEVPHSKSGITPIQIDIEDDSSIESCFKEVESKYGRVDTLINNAGASFDTAMAQKPGPAGIREAFDHAYSLNVTSTQVFTHTFAPLLIKSSSPRLLFITSGLSSLETCAGGLVSAIQKGPTPAGWPKPPELSVIGYRASKTALNMVMLDWARLLTLDGVKVFCISPGFLATGLGGVGPERLKQAGAGDPSIGGELIRRVVAGERDDDAGKVVNQGGVQPW